MNIGDRVRDKGTQFVGTIVQLDPPTGEHVRALIRADAANPVGKVGDPPPDQMWQSVGELELIDLAGKPVTGTAGKRIDAAGNTVTAPMGGDFDAQGNRIKNGGKDAKSAAATR
jgi:hypothetical protein